MNAKHVILGLIAASALAVSALPSGVSHAATAAPQGAFYLALGDSLSAGYQPEPTISWSHGWVYQLRDILAKSSPTELTDLALGGECSGTFIAGGMSSACPTKRLTSPSQLKEAVSYLKAYNGQVKLITVEVGGDNLYGHLTAFLKSTPAQQQQLVPTLFPPLIRDWTTIFGTLRQACSTCTIVAVDQYNPFPKGATTANVAKVVLAYNGALHQVAAPFGVKVADVYAAFVGNELAYTWIARGDIHATNTGYTVMAKIVAQAAGVMP